MRNKILFVLTLVLSLGLSNVSAQTPNSNSPKKISGGILNGKAKSLTKPEYPPAAKAVNASGAVNVQVTINENGDVIAASAVSGHPLLRQASEQAALSSKFAPTMLEGQPVMVTGVIVYNFVPSMNITQIGYELALAEKSQSFNKSKINSIKIMFPPSWEEEKSALASIESHLINKSAPEKTSQTASPTLNNDSLNPPNGSYQGKTTGAISTTIVGDEHDYSLDSDGVSKVRDLQSRLESRFDGRENILWAYKLGVILGKLKAEIDSNEKTRANLSELNQFAAVIPVGISEAAWTKIKAIVEAGQQTTSDTERKEKLLPLVENLRNFKVY